jgi:glutathione S-transferase
MTALQIIGSAQSNFVRTARMAAQEKGVAYELVEVFPRSKEARAIHPGGMIPVMKHGERTLFESRAITKYIDEGFEGPPLTPRDPYAAAQTEQWIAFIATSFDHAVIRQMIRGYFMSGKPDRSPDREKIDAIKDTVAQQMAVLDSVLAKQPYLGGESFNLADMYAMPILGVSRLVPEGKGPMEQNKNLHAYYEKNKARESFVTTMPPRIGR